jgi:hypothetical protein
LCEFCGRVYCDILSIFLIPQFCLFLRHQTMDKVQKHNSFKTFHKVDWEEHTKSDLIDSMLRPSDYQTEWRHVMHCLLHHLLWCLAIFTPPVCSLSRSKMRCNNLQRFVQALPEKLQLGINHWKENQPKFVSTVPSFQFWKTSSLAPVTALFVAGCAPLSGGWAELIL